MRSNVKAWSICALSLAAFGLSGCFGSEDNAAPQPDLSPEIATAVPSVAGEDVDELQRLADDAAAIKTDGPADAASGTPAN